MEEIVDYVLIKQYYDGKQNIKTILSDKIILVNSIISNKTLSTIDDVWEYINNTYGIFNLPEYDDQVNSILGMINKESYYNEKIKTLAKTCRLIGNNETHWRNKNEPGDIEMMERMLINLMKYIEMELAVDAAATYNNVDK